MGGRWFDVRKQSRSKFKRLEWLGDVIRCANVEAMLLIFQTGA
jgi:hypothetical protein